MNTEVLIYVIIGIIAFFISIRFLLRYLDGDFAIEKREVVKSNSYSVSYESRYTGNLIQIGKKLVKSIK